jgi:hypothetical protein
LSLRKKDVSLRIRLSDLEMVVKILEDVHLSPAEGLMHRRLSLLQQKSDARFVANKEKARGTRTRGGKDGGAV